MDERQWEPLEDCLDALIDYRGKTPEKTAHGVPLITAKVVKGGVIERPTEFIAHEAYSAWMRRGIPLAGDVLLTTEAPLGEVAQLKSAHVALAQRIILLRGKTGFLHNGYLKYFFLTDEGRRGLEARASGTTVLGIKQSELRRVEIPIIPFEEQTEIADTLQSLDDKIALLRETNATLEAIAQALFKSWFVDFDPVRAKAEGRDPEGVPPEVADLFPSEFEDSELGAVPKGWRVGRFNEVVGLCKQPRQPQEEPETEFEHFSLPAFDAGQSPVLETGAKIKSNKYTVPKDAVLLSKLNPHIPRVWLTKVVNESVAISSTEFLVLRPTQGASREWVYLLVRSEAVQSALCQLVTGTSNSHQRVKPDNLLDLALVCPPAPLIASFTVVVAPLLERFLANREEAKSLADLRDTLLPRLMSGKLRIHEVPV